MAARAVKGEQLLRDVETYQRRLAELGRQVKDHPERLPDVNNGLQKLSDGKGMAPLYAADQYADFRRIKGLIFLGPREWEKAMTGRDRGNRNPLDLKAGWCPQPEIPYTVDQLKELAKLCRTPEWDTALILYLALPEVAGTPTSLVGQYSWWGVKHDDLGPGTVRGDVFWSNWFFQHRSGEPAVAEPTWLIGYEHPRWTTGEVWVRQQEVAADHGMPIATVAQDVLMLNLCLSACGKRLRGITYSRTQTVYDGYPLDVHSLVNGVCVVRYWIPGYARGLVAASVQGMPRCLVS